MSDSEVNGNVADRQSNLRTSTSSVEDLSEYTDADESISAPTEILAEFLSSIMMKDYEKALKYCTLILSYEPNNVTAKEFYPLIVEKLELMQKERDYEDSSTSSSCSLTSSSSSDSSSESENDSKVQRNSDDTSASYSSLEEDRPDIENIIDDAKNSNFSQVDITNGNAKSLQRNISTPLLHETRHSEILDEKGKEDLVEETTIEEKKVDSIASPNILMHPTPTRTFEHSSFFNPVRTKTHTKSFPAQMESLTIVSDSSQPPQNIKNSKASSKRPTKKEILGGKMVSNLGSTPTVTKKEVKVKKKLQNARTKN